jgi:hypothetical protein
VPVREVYLTSGRSRRLTLGAQGIEFRHVPFWQLVLAGRPAGDAIRAIAWLGPDKAGEALRTLKKSWHRLTCKKLPQPGPAYRPGWRSKSAP